MHKFNEKKYIKTFCKKIQKEVFGKILISVSGGVDSTTSAALLKKANLDCEILLIDTGYMRENEIKEIKLLFKKLKYKLKILNKRKEFYLALEGVSNPTKKRMLFRKKYFQIFTEYLNKKNIKFIAQGTQFWNNQSKIYHNCPTKNFHKQKLKIVEPVKGLSKNNIRKLAKKLDLPKEIINRRPFPGPGLLIRFSGAFNLEKLEKTKKATLIVDKFVNKHKTSFNKCYQIFPYLCNDSFVTYVDKDNKGRLGDVILIRAITQKNTKNTIAYDPFIMKKSLSKKLIEELMLLDGIARVCFDMTPKIGSKSNIKTGATIEYI